MGHLFVPSHVCRDQLLCLLSCARRCGARGPFPVSIYLKVFSGKLSLCPEVFVLCYNSVFQHTITVNPAKHCPSPVREREIFITLHFSYEPQYLISGRCLFLT